MKTTINPFFLCFVKKFRTIEGESSGGYRCNVVNNVQGSSRAII